MCSTKNTNMKKIVYITFLLGLIFISSCTKEVIPLFEEEEVVVKEVVNRSKKYFYNSMNCRTYTNNVGSVDNICQHYAQSHWYTIEYIEYDDGTFRLLFDFTNVAIPDEVTLVRFSLFLINENVDYGTYNHLVKETRNEHFVVVVNVCEANQFVAASAFVAVPEIGESRQFEFDFSNDVDQDLFGYVDGLFKYYTTDVPLERLTHLNQVSDDLLFGNEFSYAKITRAGYLNDNGEITEPDTIRLSIEPRI